MSTSWIVFILKKKQKTNKQKGTHILRAPGMFVVVVQIRYQCFLLLKKKKWNFMKQILETKHVSAINSKNIIENTSFRDCHESPLVDYVQLFDKIWDSISLKWTGWMDWQSWDLDELWEIENRKSTLGEKTTFFVSYNLTECFLEGSLAINSSLSVQIFHSKYYYVQILSIY